MPVDRMPATMPTTMSAASVASSASARSSSLGGMRCSSALSVGLERHAAAPDLRLADERDADIGAHLQLVRALQRQQAVVGLAVLAVVDPALQLAGPGADEVVQDLQAERRRRVG